MENQLPVLWFKRKWYFLDEYRMQIRPVNNPLNYRDVLPFELDMFKSLASRFRNEHLKN